MRERLRELCTSPGCCVDDTFCEVRMFLSDDPNLFGDADDSMVCVGLVEWLPLRPWCKLRSHTALQSASFEDF